MRKQTFAMRENLLCLAGIILGGSACVTPDKSATASYPKLTSPIVVASNDSVHEFSIPAKGRIVAIQKVRLSHLRKCEAIQSLLQLTVTSLADGSQVPAEAACPFVDGNLVIQTKEYLTEGAYRVQLQKSGETQYFPENPRISAQYAHADFLSGDDPIIDGAVPLDLNAKTKGTVDYLSGDQTDWILLKGKNSVATINVLIEGSGSAAAGPSGQSGDIEIVAFELQRDVHKARPISSVVVGSPNTLQIREDDVYLRITGPRHEGERKYTIFRKDEEIKSIVTTDVVDLYPHPVQPNASVVLFKAVQGLKAGSEVTLKATREGNRRVSLAKCHISSVKDDLATCQVNLKPLTTYTGFVGEFSP